MRWSLVVIGPPGLPLVPSEVHAVDLEDVGEADHSDHSGGVQTEKYRR